MTNTTYFYNTIREYYSSSSSSSSSSGQQTPQHHGAAAEVMVEDHDSTISTDTCVSEMSSLCSSRIFKTITQILKILPNRNPRNLSTPFSHKPYFIIPKTLTNLSTVAGYYPLSSSSSLNIQKGDITKWSVDGVSDAIVNAANLRMLGGGGVDGAIHRAAGPELRAACSDVPEVRPGVRCPTGEARLTQAFMLPVSHVIHTVGPIYIAHDHPENLLRSSYRNCLKLAKKNHIQHIAFPAISSGLHGYPYDEAATIAISTVKEFAGNFKEVHFVLFFDDIYNVWLEKANSLL